ncbi:MAG TPA: cation-translocating P-type ATPase, partial [Anaerolineales bacterium]|nr:cation-translocating P-type ATPase [Anaerolineales bacterium]
QNPPPEFHAIGILETLEYLETSDTNGLTSEKVRQIQAQVGLNQLDEAPPTSIWQLLWEQINSFVIWLLLVAVIISAVLGDWAEAIAILLIVVLNAVLGVVQERRAEQALAALRQMASPDSVVIRDGHRQTVPAREVVPGDIVLLEAGNYVPADLRLIESINLRIEEAALTGESVPSNKDTVRPLKEDIPIGDRRNSAFAGTIVSYGRGKGVIINTGMRTQIGRIAQMLQAVEQEQTPLQKRLDELGRTLGYTALALCGLVFILVVFRETDVSLITSPNGGIGAYFQNSIDAITTAFLIAVSLAIAAVPEGLPAVVTIALALGMREMVKRHSLIRRLSSVETLGSATVICSDKTGTLTQNAMTVTRLWVDSQFFEITGTGYTPKGEFHKNGEQVWMRNYPGALTALWIGALNNDAVLEYEDEHDQEPEVRVVGDPTEAALLVAAAKAGSLQKALAHSYPRVQEIPFDSARKRMVTFHEVRDPHDEDISPFTEEQNRVHVAILKGAPDLVLGLCTQYQGMDDNPCPLTPEMREKIMAANNRMTGDALRVLGMAYRVTDEVPDDLSPENIEHDLIFAGLVGMIDPPRTEVRPALEKALHAGIRTVMITGDYPNTAAAIANAIGLMKPGQEVLTGADLNEMDQEKLQGHVNHTAVFARVSPEHKVRIVEALRANKQIVAMTGDGVNDAPAIKLADIGVAMGITGTDVAKETADMVLTDDNYASIVSAVEQGRVIYSNIRKFVYYLLSCNLAEIATITIATLMGLPHPLEAIQLLWLNLVTDGAPALALGVEKGDPDTMDVPPRPTDEPIINRPLRVGIITQTISLTLVTLSAFLLGLYYYPNFGDGSQETIHRLARTMAFVALSGAELPLAFIVRSERYSLLKIGPFSNRTMNIAVFSSVFLLLMVIYIPFFRPIFETVPLGWEQWRLLLPMLFIPAIVAEMVKALTAKNWSQTS